MVKFSGFQKVKMNDTNTIKYRLISEGTGSFTMGTPIAPFEFIGILKTFGVKLRYVGKRGTGRLWLLNMEGN